MGYTKVGAEGSMGGDYVAAVPESDISFDTSTGHTHDGSDSTAVAAHKTSHQNDGGDEISVAGLSGLLADDQHVLDAEVTAAVAASDYGKRPLLIKLIDDATALGTGDGKFIFVVPDILSTLILVKVEAHVTTPSSSGIPTYSIYNLTTTNDMLSTSITIDENEYTSETAATPPVINTNYDNVSVGDRIEINKDVAGTGEKGDEVFLVFQLP